MVTKQDMHYLLMTIYFTLLSTKRCLCDTDFSHIEHIKQFEPVHYDTNELRYQHHMTKRSTSQPIRFDFEAFGRRFPIYVEPDNSIYHPKLVVETDQGRQLFDSSRVYRGHVEGEQSFIHGVITKNGHFEGKIYLPHETFFVERSEHHFVKKPKFHTLIYKLSDVTFNSSLHTCAFEKVNQKQRELYNMKTLLNDSNAMSIPAEGEKTNWRGKYAKEYNTETFENGKYIKSGHERRKREVDPTKVTCELYMQADHLYFEKYDSNIETVIDKLTEHVQAVTTIYSSIDFDGSGSPDNIGFIIKKIKIYTDPAAADYKYPGNYAVDYLLDKHSEDNYDDFCLSYLFTNRDFSDGVLGLAWIADLGSIGGVCEKHATIRGIGKSLNTGIVTELNYGTSVPAAVTHVTFAHEIGHNFGSPHDPESDNVCTPGGDDGNFIMYARATSGLKPNNDELSSCSIAIITPILEQKARSATGCFVEFKGQICGNRVVEGDEECDCGWEDECSEGCCNPQVSNSSAPGVETPCTRRSTAVCSPSQGPCCTTDCQYADTNTTCRSTTACLNSANCNYECPQSEHWANQTECGSETDFQVCYNGECTSSVCLAYGRESCQCAPAASGDWTDSRLCQVCCMDGEVCKSSYDLGDIPDKEVAAGSPCFDFQGYCDVFKKCRQVDPSGPLSNLRRLIVSGEALETLKDFLTEHWYIGIAGGVVLVIIVECTSSVCLAYGRESCQCAPAASWDWTDSHLCQVCCMDGEVCKSSYDLGDIPDKEVAAGSPCFDFQGYCDVFKKCRQVDPSGPLSNLRRLIVSGEALETLKDFLTEHWYIGIAGGIVLVIIVVLVVKFCSKSHKPVENDKPSSHNRETPMVHTRNRQSKGTRNQVEPFQWT